MRPLFPFASILIPAAAFGAAPALTGPAIEELRGQIGGTAFVQIAEPGTEVPVDLNGVDTSKGNAGRIVANSEFAKYGITLTVSAGTVNILKNKDVYGGGLLIIPLEAAIVLHEGTQSDPISFSMRFDPPIDGISFERPAMAAGESGVWVAEWSANVFAGESLLYSNGEKGFGKGVRLFDPEKTHPGLWPRVQPGCGKFWRCGPGPLEAFPFEFEHSGITRVEFHADGHGHDFNYQTGASMNSVSLYNIRIFRK